ncbi:MAG: diguanylate cyclase [Sulfuritalea sp.]|nr:diguanylate cyclase [Sulfuritalea sp.]
MSHSDFKTDHSWFKQLFESSPDPTWIIDGNRFVECNEAAIRTLGYTSREEFLDVHPSKLSPPRQPDGQDSYAKAERMMAIAKDKGLHRFEWIHTKADGTNFVAEVTLSIIELRDRQVIYCVWRDITERKSTEEKLLRQNNMLSAIVENFPGGISLVDADLRVTAHNDNFKRLMDFPDSLFAKPDLHFEDIIRFNAGRGEYGPGDPEQQVAAIVARARNFQPHKIERVRPNGTALEIRGMPLPDGGFVTIYIDITERKQMEDQVRQLAFYDDLTKLPNRRLLNDRLSQTMAVSKRSGCYGALMFLDLDNFKPLNDTHGHVVGDLLLIEAADRLKCCVREMDTVARFGGDEFVVMLSDLNADKAESTSHAEIVAEKIRIRLSEPYLLTIRQEGKEDTTVEHHCTVSIGVTLFIDHEASQDDILKWADVAMYQAKEAGRNSIRFYDSKA